VFRLTVLAMMLLAAPARAPRLVFQGAAEVFLPGVVSTERSEIKVTVSPDGTRVLWGTLSWPGGPGGWDIWESVKTGSRWGAPHVVSFDSPANDFDPSFAPDGSAVYFFSNRPGGQGGDDLYVVPFDRTTGQYGRPENLGPEVNTKGDEWGPSVSADGKLLLFASDGHGGFGRHDLFVAHWVGGRWTALENLGPGINSIADEYDGAMLDEGQAIVFSSNRKHPDKVELYVSFRGAKGYEKATQLGNEVNREEATEIGSAVRAGEPGVLYFSSQGLTLDSPGRSDIYRIRYRIVR
jgi:TolB protein